MPDIKVAVIAADAREERTVTTGTKAWELFSDDTDVVAARVGGELRDLSHELADGDEVEPVAIGSPDGRDILRHSTAHVLAQAVQQLWPEARLGIGPPVQDGFYYDFDVAEPFVPEDLARLETAMRKIIKENQRFQRRVTTDADALALAGRGGGGGRGSSPVPLCPADGPARHRAAGHPPVARRRDGVDHHQCGFGNEAVLLIAAKVYQSPHQPSTPESVRPREAESCAVDNGEGLSPQMGLPAHSQDD